MPPSDSDEVVISYLLAVTALDEGCPNVQCAAVNTKFFAMSDPPQNAEETWGRMGARWSDTIQGYFSEDPTGEPPTTPSSGPKLRGFKPFGGECFEGRRGSARVVLASARRVNVVISFIL